MEPKHKSPKAGLLFILYIFDVQQCTFGAKVHVHKKRFEPPKRNFRSDGSQFQGKDYYNSIKKFE